MEEIKKELRELNENISKISKSIDSLSYGLTTQFSLFDADSPCTKFYSRYITFFTESCCGTQNIIKNTIVPTVLQGKDLFAEDVLRVADLIIKAIRDEAMKSKKEGLEK